METIKRYYRIDRREVYFVKFIIEAYDGIAQMSSLDPARGIVVIYIAHGCADIVDVVIKELKKDILIEKIDWEDK